MRVKVIASFDEDTVITYEKLSWLVSQDKFAPLQEVLHKQYCPQIQFALGYIPDRDPNQGYKQPRGHQIKPAQVTKNKLELCTDKQIKKSKKDFLGQY